MRGLLKNNLYASIANIKWFTMAMLIFALIVICLDNDSRTLLLAFLLISIVGFPVNAIASLRKECGSKWCKYKITVPVKRSDIVKSYFYSQTIWLLIGLMLAGICVCLSIFAHGFPFDRNTDILMIFTMGIGMSLLIGAIFYPLFHLGGDEKNEVILIISFLCAVGIMAGLVRLINWVLGKNPPSLEIILGAVCIMVFSVLMYWISYFVTVGIFKKKEFQ